jgi:hypothetical protein
MNILNSSDISKFDAKNAQLRPINPRVRALLISPGTSNAFSDHPGFWRANDSQPFTAIWGCKAIVPAEAIRTRYF